MEIETKPADETVIDNGANQAPVIDTVEKTTETKSGYDNMQEFIKTLDPELQSHKSWSKFKTPQELAKSYSELEKLVGKKGEIPKQDATKEEWDLFYSKLGRPEKVEDYKIGIRDELKGGEERLNKALQLAHDAGITKAQADKLFAGLMEQEVEMVKGIDAQRAELLAAEETKLRQTWGHGFDKMADVVERFEKSLGIFETFEQKGLNTDADLLILLGNLASRLGEDPEVNVARSSTPAGLDAELSEINTQIKEYLKKGEKVPKHLTQRREDIFNRKYRD
jgi:hypothetical protein